MRISLYVLATAGMVAAMVVFWPVGDGSRILGRQVQSGDVHTVDLLSAPYTLDRIYLSMRGPRSNQARIQLLPDRPADETVWITGVGVSVVDADTIRPISNEYFCHTNLTLNPDTTSPEKHNQSFASPVHANWRFFTLVPGRMEVRLPAGFGVPVKNGTLLDNFTMTLNQNPGQPTHHVRLKTRIWFQTDEAAAGSLRPLFRRALYVYQQHAPTTAARGTTPAMAVIAPMRAHQGELCGENCTQDQRGGWKSTFETLQASKLDFHPGATCCVENATPEGVMQQFGKENTVHWMVPPGSHRYVSDVSPQLDLPFDTTVHYVTGHLHPFGKSLKLIDRDTGKTVFEIQARDYRDRLGVESISEIVDRQGVPLRREGHYQLVADYDNSTDHPIDAMAILYLYALDEPPASAASPAKTGVSVAR